ncbi:MAG: undecaprenyl-diphosphate phosphatase [Anaerolineaceae bacterium]|nr:undecaprenyl-diphosphate phosphatase [Anaerolineaceae bacterium]
MIEWLKVIALGILEGITEFLPISSTGHLIVGVALLDFKGSANGTFDIFIQFGAIVAVIIYYRKDIFHQLRTVRTDSAVQRFWLNIFVAFLPAAFFGFMLRHWIKDVLFSPVVVAMALIVGGIIFLWVERHPQPEATPSSEKGIPALTVRQAFIVGFSQIIALIPGISRSGATIIGGMEGGLSRQAATQFSFYLAIPTLGGATLYELLTSLDQITSQEIGMLLVGAVVSGIIAWFSIGWLLRYVSHNSFVPFGYYRILAGTALLLLIAAGVLS